MHSAPSKDENSQMPVHVAIIMDGNGRWAKARGLPRFAGHKRGAEAVRQVVKGARELGISYLTLYAFSSENWNRPAEEVDDLMGLLRLYLRRELAELHAQNVRVRFIGLRDRLSADILDLIEDAESRTSENSGLTLCIALNYGGHAEILNAVRAIAAEVEQGSLKAGDITAELFEGHLHTAGIPHPDLLIRTSGEQRLSNFLLWQCAYTELIFMDTLWPDFTKKHLEGAVAEFNRRERRFGATSG